MQENKRKKLKKNYQKPEVHIIDLAADEVMVQGCKLVTGGGPNGTSCTLPSQCTGLGS